MSGELGVRFEIKECKHDKESVAIRNVLGISVEIRSKKIHLCVKNIIK